MRQPTPQTCKPSKLSREDILRYEVLTLKQQALAAERNTLNREMLAKYGLPGETELRVAQDGTIQRPQKKKP